MKLIRFTVDGKGIFRVLPKMFEEADMPVQDEQELFDAEEVFERDLPIPEIFLEKGIRSTSWFTENGFNEFKDALETIAYYADLYLGEKLEKTVIEYDEETLYKDYFQVVLAA